MSYSATSAQIKWNKLWIFPSRGTARCAHFFPPPTTTRPITNMRRPTGTRLCRGTACCAHFFPRKDQQMSIKGVVNNRDTLCRGTACRAPSPQNRGCFSRGVTCNALIFSHLRDKACLIRASGVRRKEQSHTDFANTCTVFLYQSGFSISLCSLSICFFSSSLCSSNSSIISVSMICCAGITTQIPVFIDTLPLPKISPSNFTC